MLDGLESGTDWCTPYLGQLGARGELKMLRVQGKKKKSLALRSLRSSVVLVTPNFRENRTEEGEEGENNAIFPGNFPPQKQIFTPHVAIDTQ